MGGGQSESVHFFPPPWETALVHSHRSRQQTPPYRPRAPCGCTRAALMSMSHRAGGTCLGTPSPDPSSPPSVSFVLPRLPGSPGTTPGALSNTGTTGRDGREDAVQCLWGCACNREEVLECRFAEEGPETGGDGGFGNFPPTCHQQSALSSCPLARFNLTVMYLILKVICTCSHLLTLMQMIKENR